MPLCHIPGAPGHTEPRARSHRAPASCLCLLQGSGLSWEHPGEQKLDVCDVTLLEAAQRDKDPVLREFLRLLALCHTVMVEDRGGGLRCRERGRAAPRGSGAVVGFGSAQQSSAVGSSGCESPGVARGTAPVSWICVWGCFKAHGWQQKHKGDNPVWGNEQKGS